MERQNEGRERRNSNSSTDKKMMDARERGKSNETPGNESKTKNLGKKKNGGQISNEFPNFEALTKEEKFAFFEALSMARRNVEKTGARTRERFGTIHDEYLQYFECGQRSESFREGEKISVSSTSFTTQATYVLSTSPDDAEDNKSEKSADSLRGEVASEDAFLTNNSQDSVDFGSIASISQAPLKDEKKKHFRKCTSSDPVAKRGTVSRNTASVTAEAATWAECETVLTEDQNKIIGLYLKKKRAAEEKKVDSKERERERRRERNEETLGRSDRRTDPENLPVYESRSKVASERVNKENVKPSKSNSREGQKEKMAFEAQAKVKQTPKFDALNSEEKELFFNILREAHENVVQESPRSQVVTLESILKGYRMQNDEVVAFPASTEEIPPQREKPEKEGKNLRVKLTVRSMDNERIKMLESQKEKESVVHEEPSKDLKEEELSLVESKLKTDESASSSTFREIYGNLKRTGSNMDESDIKMEDVNAVPGSENANKQEPTKQDEKSKVKEKRPTKCSRRRRMQEEEKEGNKAEEEMGNDSDNKLGEDKDEIKKDGKTEAADDLAKEKESDKTRGDKIELSHSAKDDDDKKKVSSEEKEKVADSKDRIDSVRDETKDKTGDSKAVGDETKGNKLDSESPRGDNVESDRKLEDQPPTKTVKKETMLVIPTQGKVDVKFLTSKITMSSPSRENSKEKTDGKIPPPTVSEVEETKSDAGSRIGIDEIDDRSDLDETCSADENPSSGPEEAERDVKATRGMMVRKRSSSGPEEAERERKMVRGTIARKRSSSGPEETELEVKADEKRSFGVEEIEREIKAVSEMIARKKSSSGPEEIEREMKAVREMVPDLNGGKVVLVDDGVIEKIKRLIGDLERKAKQEGNAEGNEYVRLLLSYVDYLSNVLRSLVSTEEKTNMTRIRQSLTNPNVFLKFQENPDQPLSQADKMDHTVQRSVSHSGITRANTVEGDAKDDNGKADSIDADKTSSLVISSPSLESASTIHSEDDLDLMAPMFLKKKNLPATKIRVLQDLLNERAAFVEGSITDYKIVHLPQSEYRASDAPTVRLNVEEEDEDVHSDKGTKSKILRLLAKICRCGRKETAEESNMLENLKGEAVAVNLSAEAKNPASVTLNESTMEVLKAAERKRIIEKYWKTN